MKVIAFRYQEMVRLIIIFALLLLTLIGRAQNTTKYFHISVIDHSGEIKVSRFFLETNPKDSLSCLIYLQEGLKKSRASGYLAASIDSIIWHGDSAKAYFYPGRKFNWARLSQGNVDNEYLSNSFKRQFTGHAVSLDQTNELLETILKHCENDGYPFASIRLDSLISIDSILTGTLILNKGVFTSIDSIRINGPSFIAPVYLQNYISIKPGDPYREILLSKAESRLRELPFIKVSRSPAITFTEKYTRLDLYIEPKKASQFDGVIGLLPDATGKGKTSITGEVHIKLQNSFKRGETIELNWKQLPPRSQDLNLHARYPFLFNSPIGADALLSLYRRDTLFVDVNKNLGMIIMFKGNNFIKGYIDNKQSNLQSTYGLENATTLPSYADISTTSYGISWNWESLDYRLNPRRGFSTSGTFNTGNRNIEKNAGINPIVYDGLSLKTTQYKGEVQMQYFIPIYNQHIITLSSRTGFIYNEKLFINEVYRIGGLKSLRGFDEESIFASTYSIFNVEYRLQTDINSFLFTFFNGAWYERNISNAYFHDLPFGFGVGYNFETRLGIMSVSYALGEQKDAPLQFRNGKVHFGIINYF